MHPVVVVKQWLPKFDKITVNKVVFKFWHLDLIDLNQNHPISDLIKHHLCAIVYLEYNGRIVKFEFNENQLENLKNLNLFNAMLSVIKVPSSQRPILRQAFRFNHFYHSIRPIYNQIMIKWRRAIRTKSQLTKLDKILKYNKRQLNKVALKQAMNKVVNILSTQDINRLWKETQQENIVSIVMKS